MILKFGIIGAVTAFGTVAGNLLFGKFEKKIGRSRAIIFGTISAAIYFLIFQFNTPIYVIGIFALSMGLLNGMAGLSINAYFAEEVPNEIRGRAYSATNAYIALNKIAEEVFRPNRKHGYGKEIENLFDALGDDAEIATEIVDKLETKFYNIIEELGIDLDDLE